MKLLLIDSRIQNYQLFITSCKSDVDYIVFDYLTDTYASLLSKITAKGSSISDIALVQHANMVKGFQMLANEDMCNSGEDAPFPSFNALRSFLSNLKNQVGLEIFDFLACALYDAEKMPLVFQVLEQELAINLRASTNFTGNAPDGDWIMESDNVDIRDNYFTEAIQDFKGTLGVEYSYIRFIVTHLLGKGALVGIGELFLYGNTPGLSGTALYPPIRLTTNNTTRISDTYYIATISGELYGNGTYNITSSNTGYSLYPWYAFNNTRSSAWYSTENGLYSDTLSGSIPTFRAAKTTVNGVSICGEWLQIQLPVSIDITRLRMLNAELQLQRFADGMVIAGSTDGITWNNIATYNYDDNTKIVNTLINGIGYDATLILQESTPDAPTSIIKAVDVTSGICVSFIPGYDGGSPILYYNVIATPPNGSPITVSGLTSPIMLNISGNNINNYSISVNAVNAFGTGVNSTPGNVTTLYTDISKLPPTWVQWIDGIKQDRGIDITTDLCGNVYSTGYASSGIVTISGITYTKPSNDFNSGIYIVKYKSDGAFQWVQWVDGSGSDQGLGITTDSMGTVYCTGYVNSGTVTISGIEYTKPSNDFNWGSYIIKYTIDGVFQWVQWIDGSGNDRGQGIASDSNGNVYSTGYVSTGIVTISGMQYTKPSNVNNSGAYIIKYKSDGAFQWVQWVDGSGTDVGHSIKTDLLGNVYSTGYAGTGIVTISGIDYTKPSNGNNYGAYIIKYKSDGAFQWVQWVDGNGTDDIGRGITVDSLGNVYSTGYINSQTLTISGIEYTKPSNASTSTVYVVKYDSDGAFKWLQWIDGSGNDQGMSVATNSSGDVYCTGYVSTGSVTISGITYSKPSNYSDIGAYIVKYKSNGSLSWVQWIDGINTDVGNSIHVDSYNNIYCTGYSNSQLLIIGGEIHNKPFNYFEDSAYIIKFADITYAVPSAPTAVSATHADSEVTVSFTESASNGGSAILYYTVSVSGEALSVSGVSSPLTLTGLTNGVQYTLTVTATNAEGASIASEPVQATPATIPGVPTSVVAQKGDGQAVVSFSVPTSDGGSAVLYYTVSVSGADPAITVSGEQSPITVTGLTNGVQYTLKVTVTNAEGTSAESDAVQVTPATLPDGPTSVTAVKGNASAVVSFTAPVYDGGAVIAYYNVVSSPDSVTVSGLSSPITIGGLTNGQEYTFNVTAVNADAEESAAGMSNAVTPMTVPGVPTAVSAAHSSEQVAVSFAAPVSDGGSAVLYYTVSVSGSDPAITVSGEQSPIVVQGLTNGLLYTLIVTATNSEGVSAAEIVQATPATIPGAPTSVSAERGNTQVSVSFTAPASNGGSSVLYYTVSVSGEAITVSGEQSPIVVQGLTNGQEYTLKVTATNAEGMSAESDAVQATPVTVPDAPTSIDISIGHNSLIATIGTPASNGGSSILYYNLIATSDIGNIITVSGASSPITITNIITDGRKYSFSVNAVNDVSGGASITTESKYYSDASLNWIKWVDGTSNERGQAVTTDIYGNVYTIGYAESSTLTLDGIVYSRPSGTGEYGYIIKRSVIGEVAWVRFMKDIHDVKSIRCDSVGFIYIVGMTWASSISISGITYNAPSSGRDAYLIKMNTSTCEVSWVQWIGGPSNELGWGVAPDNLGNVYMTGYTQTNSSITISGIAFNKPTDSAQNHDAIFITKFKDTGVFEWIRWVDSNKNEQITNCIVTDNEGNIYITPNWIGSNTAYIIDRNITKPLSGEYGFAMIIKISPSGSLVWNKTIDTNGNGPIIYSCTNDKDGNLYSAGYAGSTSLYINGQFYFKPNTSTTTAIFIIKHNKNGDFMWIKWLDTVSFNYANIVAVRTDSINNVYMIAEIDSQSVTISGIVYTKPTSGSNSLLVKYDTNGIFKWIYWINNKTGTYNCRDLAIDIYNNIYFTSYAANATIQAGNDIYYKTISGTDSGAYLMQLADRDYIYYATTVPSTPLDLSFTQAPNQVTVSFSAPQTNGGSQVLYYNVTSYPGLITVSGVLPSITVTGLTNAVEYRFKVSAVNVNGEGSYQLSDLIMPIGNPSVPQNMVITDAYTTAKVTFTAPATDGGRPVLYYVLTDVTDNVTVSGVSSPLYMKDLTADISHVFSLKAVTDFGESTTVTQTEYIKNTIIDWLQINNNIDNVETYTRDMKIDASGNIYVVGYTNQMTISGVTTYHGKGILYIIRYNPLGKIEWSRYIVTNTSDYNSWDNNIPNRIELDNSGNLYIAGSTRNNSIKIHGTSIVFNRPKPTSINDWNLTERAAVIIKMSTVSGAISWVQWIDGLGNDIAETIAIDSTGDIIVGGIINPGTTLTSGTYVLGNPNVTISGITYTKPLPVINNDYNETAGFISKFSPNGVLTFFNWIDATRYDQLNGVCVDSSNNIYAIGNTYGSSVIINDVSYNRQNTSDGAYLVKYDSSGSVQNVIFIDGNSADYGDNIIIDNSGNLYLTIRPSSSSITISGVGITRVTSTRTTSDGNYNIALIKLNNTLNVEWVRWIQGENNEIITNISVSSNGLLYLTGYTTSTRLSISGVTYNRPSNIYSVFNSTTTNCSFNIIMTSDGLFKNILWLVSMYSDSVPRAIKTNKNGDIFITGYFFKPSLIDGTIYNDLSYANITNMQNYIIKYKNIDLDIPFAPQYVTAVTSNNNITVRFENYYNNTYPVLYYTITEATTLQSYTTTSTTFTISGLTIGESYRYYVTATNAIGTSSKSIISNQVVFGIIVPTHKVTVGSPYTLNNIDNNYVARAKVVIDNEGYIYNVTTLNVPSFNGLYETSNTAIYIVKYNKQFDKIWDKYVDNPDMGDYIYDVCIDISNNLNIVGISRRYLQIDGTKYYANMDISSYNCGYLLKLDSSGSYQNIKWFYQTTTDVVVLSVTSDEYSNIYIGGNTVNNPNSIFIGDISYARQTITSNPMFIAKLDSNFNVLGMRWINGSGTVYTMKYKNNKIFFAGNTYSNLNISGLSYAPTSAIQNYALYYICMTDSLEINDVKWIDTNNTDSPFSIDVDSNMNVYISATLRGPSFTISGIQYTNITKIGTANAGVLIKINSDKTIGWVRFIDSIDTIYLHGLYIDISDNIHVCGKTGGEYTYINDRFMNYTYNRGFISKYDTDGNFIYIITDNTTGGTLNDIVVDASFNMYTIADTVNLTRFNNFPSKATISGVTSNVTSATVSFSTPSTNGGYSILYYTATATPGDITISGLSNSLTISGLTTNQEYTITVKPYNILGVGDTTSINVKVGLPTVPLNVTASSIFRKTTVTFSTPINNGDSPILYYNVTANPNGEPGTLTISGISGSVIFTDQLLYNIPYTFTVRAVNARGEGMTVTTKPIIINNYGLSWAIVNNRNNNDYYYRNVKLDSSGNIYIIGYTSNNTLTLSGYLTQTNGTRTISGVVFTRPITTSDYVGFIAKFDSNMLVQWLQWIGTSSPDYIYNLTLDNNNNVYCAGITYGIIINTGGVFTTLKGSNTHAVFLVKYSSDGIYQWSNFIDSSGSSSTSDSSNKPYSIVCDSSNNVLMSCVIGNNSLNSEYYFNDISFTKPIGFTNTDNMMGILVKYDSSGSKLWHSIFDSSGSSNVSDGFYGLTVDSNNNIFITAITDYNWSGSRDYTLFNQIYTRPLTYEPYTFISKLNPNGQPITIQTIFRRHYLTTMTVDGSNNLLLGGYSADYMNNVAYGITISGQSFYKSNQNSNYAGILIKLSNDLSPLFVKWIDGLNNEYINDIITDSYNNIYVGGQTNSVTVSISGPTTIPASDFSSPLNKTNTYNSGFIAKYNMIGEKQYVKWINNLTHNSYIYGIDVDPYGTIYGVGTIDGLNYTIDNIPFSKSAHGVNGYITKIAELAPPRNVVVTPDFERIILTFTPAITTGIPLLTYRVQCLSGDTVIQTLETLSNNFTITGLSNNVDYSFVLVADYGIDIAPPVYTNRLSPTQYGTPLVIPNPPTNVVATPLNQSASVAFNYPEPAYDVAFYSVNVSPGNMTISGTVSPILVTGLTNGQEYAFSVFATNLAGTSSASIFSSPVTPNSAPAPPTNIIVVGGDKQATLSWTAPAGTVSYYIIKASDYKTYTTTNTSLTISGLNNGNIYTFNVTAVNYIGEGIPSVESSNAYIGVATNAPVIGSATISNRTATVTVTAPTYSQTESFAASSYIAYAYPLGSNVATISGTSASTSISVPNLVAGTNYTFKVRAVNPVPAISAESDATNLVTATNGSGTTPASPVITKVAGNKEASFSWTTPTPVSAGINTVSYIINFTISGGSDASTITNRFVTSTSITISGLTNGSFYNFNVRAVNANGYGTIASSVARPATIPDAPTLSGGIIPTHRTLEFNFNAPAWNGGEDILYYVLTLPSASRTVSGLTSSFTISGLTNGTLYTGSLYAVNVMGNGTSLTISGIPNPTPSTVPLDAVAVSLSGGKARISFSAPVYDGGAPITSYQVLSSPGGVTASGSSPITISGLTDGTAYTFTVRALNSAGYSSYSTASNTVYPGTVPTAPAAPTVTITNNTATVAYTTTISAGTLPVLYYVATSTPGDITVSGTSSPFTFTGLTAGTSYTFSVCAVSNVGSSTASSESNLVTATIGSGDVPAAPAITTTAANTQATFSWTTPASVSAGVNTLSYIINLGLSGGSSIITNRFVTVSGITISGLTNGSFYNFSVRAVNINGYGLTATSSVRPATIADAPTISGSAIATHRTLQFNFNAPASNGGEDILYYVLSIPSISRTVSGISSPLTISGLTNGTLYSVMIYAVNAMGNGTSLLTTGTPNPTPATAPLNAYAVSQPNGTAKIFFNPPTENGGAPVTSYEAISTPGSITASGVSFVTMTGLTNGTGYTFKVRALNSAGYGSYSNVTNTIYPGTVPTAPATPVATITNTTASVAYTATISEGTLPVQYYVATSVPHGISVSGTSSPISVPGLTAGINYKFTVKAVSNVGESTESVESNLVTATEGAGLGPSNPLVTVVSVSGAVTITYVPVISTPPVVSYTLFAPGIAGWIPRTNISSPFTVSGLTNGTSYSFTLKANNANRPSTGASITAVPYTTPLSAPTITDVSGKDGLVRVSFTGISSGAASTGGSEVTTYVATSTPGNIVGYSSTSPITISGLTDRTPYTFKVAAVNAAGTGIYSTASDTFTLQTTTPTTGESALFLSTQPDAPATTNYVQMYTDASPMTVKELYIELRQSKKTYEETASENQINKVVKDMAVAIAIKAGSQTLDLSFSEIKDTLNIAISGLDDKLVTTFLPDFSSNAIPMIDLSSTVPTTYILLEVPTKALFQITDGNVTKTYMQDISGTTKYVTNTETGRKYYLGDSITVGTFSKRIVGFGSILLAETNVTVTLPITFTISGVDIQIFGQLFTMTGTKINVTNTLSASAFYDPCGQSWIQYMQDASENDFRATVKDISAAMAIKGAINSAVNIDASYNLAWKGYNNLDASAVFQNVESAWTKYHNLPDFVLSYFANKLLGHPGALAAISNDSSIRTNVSQGFSASLNEMQNMNEDKLKSIVQQMMNQDLARFNIDEKGVYNSLKFLPGDKVIMRMLLSNNTYSLKSPAGSPSSVVGGVTEPVSQFASTAKVNIGSTDDYLLVFTLA